MEYLNQLITILRDIAGLTFEESRELAEQIINIFTNGDDVTNNTGVTIQQIQQVLAQVENQSNALIIGKINQSQQILSNQLLQVQNNIINYVRANIVNANQQVMTAINQIRVDLATHSQIIRTQIVISEQNILYRLNQLPQIFQQLITQQTVIILRRIDEMTSAISQAILLDIRSEQEIATLLNRTLIQLFGNFPSRFADDFYTKFAPLLEREPETPLSDLLPDIQELLRVALIDSYASNEFRDNQF